MTLLCCLLSMSNKVSTAPLGFEIDPIVEGVDTYEQA